MHKIRKREIRVLTTEGREKDKRCIYVKAGEERLKNC
jgi:ribosomal protein L14E/L6E/L27E